MKYPATFFAEIEQRGYGLKGVTDNPEVFISGSVSRDADGTLAWRAQCYIQRALETYERTMWEKPKSRLVPMPKEAHPELDLSPLLDEDGQRKFQSLIGCLQWCVTLGSFDIGFCVMSMSWFHGCPREQHLVWLGNIFCYLRKYPDGAIRFRTHIPDHESVHGI